MEENKNEEGVVSENKNALSDNNPDVGAATTAEATPLESKPAETPAEMPSVAPQAEEKIIETAPPAETTPSVDQTAEVAQADARESAPENKAEPLSVVEVNEKKGGVAWRAVFIIIIIVVIFLLVKFFSNNEQPFNVLDSIANVNIKVSDEQEQGKVNIIEEDNKKLNEQVSEQAENEPELTTTPATGSATASTTKITAFYPNTIKNPGALDCSKVFALERNAEKKYDSNIINTIRGLLTALTPEEKAQGFITNIPAGTMLKTVKITDQGVAEVNFTAALNRIGGSCAVTAARAQIEKTVNRLPGVKSVLICVDGNCNQDEILQP